MQKLNYPKYDESDKLSQLVGYYKREAQVQEILALVKYKSVLEKAKAQNVFQQLIDKIDHVKSYQKELDTKLNDLFYYVSRGVMGTTLNQPSDSVQLSAMLYTTYLRDIEKQQPDLLQNEMVFYLLYFMEKTKITALEHPSYKTFKQTLSEIQTLDKQFKQEEAPTCDEENRCRVFCQYFVKLQKDIEVEKATLQELEAKKLVVPSHQIGEKLEKIKQLEKQYRALSKQSHHPMFETISNKINDSKIQAPENLNMQANIVDLHNQFQRQLNALNIDQQTIDKINETTQQLQKYQQSQLRPVNFSTSKCFQLMQEFTNLKNEATAALQTASDSFKILMSQQSDAAEIIQANDEDIKEQISKMQNYVFALNSNGFMHTLVNKIQNIQSIPQQDQELLRMQSALSATAQSLDSMKLFDKIAQDQQQLAHRLVSVQNIEAKDFQPLVDEEKQKLQSKIQELEELIKKLFVAEQQSEELRSEKMLQEILLNTASSGFLQRRDLKLMNTIQRLLTCQECGKRRTAFVSSKGKCYCDKCVPAQGEKYDFKI